MEFRRLGRTGLKVSKICLGTMQFGWSADETTSHNIMSRAIELGCNFFDTADVYSRWAEGNDGGVSEQIIGNWLAAGHVRRDSLVLATKVRGQMGDGPNDQGLSRVHIMTAVENSLRRLQTDYIDIYQLHEGSYDPELAPALRDELEALVKEGKIRWYGWSTDLVDRARAFADGTHCTSIQFRLNAVFDNAEMRQLCQEFNLAGLNKDPLNKGILTGKYTQTATFPEDDIRSQVSFAEDRIVRRLKTVEALREIFTAGGRTMAQGALCYILGLDERMVPIPGFKNVKQVEDNAGALAFGPMSAEEVAQVQAIVAEYEPVEA